MNGYLLVFSMILAGLQFGLPHRWAFLPLLIAACHAPNVQFAGSFTIVRIVIIVGLVRAWAGGFLRMDMANPMDRLIGLFGMISLLSSFAYPWDDGAAFITRLRIAMDVTGAYLFARAYLADRDALVRFSMGLALVIIPFGLMMLFERMTATNPYRLLGGQSLMTIFRDGEVRAQGTFGTPILAGTAAASSIPFFVLLWNVKRKLAIAAMIAVAMAVVSTSSSGPIATAMAAAGMIYAWRWRERMGAILIWLVVALVVLHFIKERPVWYLMALMDFVGGSTGWHRAYLIDMAIKHLGEWWAFGTSFTRHWMPYGLQSDPNNCDITNYYIQLGVTGGLALPAMLMAIQWRSFSILGNQILGGHAMMRRDTRENFHLWCLVSALAAHAVTFLSISYFDQMHVFFWVLIGGVSGFVIPASSPYESRVHATPALT